MEQRRPPELVGLMIAEATLGETPLIAIQNLLRLLTKKEIVDWIVAEATLGRFKGDKRDGETPPIAIQHFTNEMVLRHPAKLLRARLARLSRSELLTEAIAAVDYVKAQREQISQSGELAERYDREEAVRVLRQRQAELGRRSRLQPDILAAARYYRDQGISAGEAWDALYENPFKTVDVSIVRIEGSKVSRLKQRMRVVSPDGRQKKRSIRFDQWRQSYWRAAAKPG